MTVEINITTCARVVENYLAGTLARLDESEWHDSAIPVRLLFGSDEGIDMGAYRSDRRFEIVPWDRPAPTRRDGTRNWHDGATLNQARAIRYGDLGRDCLVFEDDVAFCDDWLTQIDRTVAEIRACAPGPFVVSLYLPFARFEAGGGNFFAPYNPTKFYGTQGMYYPAAVRAPLADFMVANLGRRPNDLLIGQWIAANAALYATRPSLIQHCGRVTVGLSARFHQAPSFVPPRKAVDGIL